MHEGWYNAAKKLIKFLDDYATSKNITGKVKVWIADFSRGGATLNIAAGLLDNDIYNNKKYLQMMNIMFPDFLVQNKELLKLLKMEEDMY